MAKTKKHFSNKKKRVRGGGLWEDVRSFFQPNTQTSNQSDPTKPELKIPEKPIEQVQKVAANTVKQGAESVGVAAPPSEEGVPGGETKLEEAKMLGGRRRKTKKSKKSKKSRR